MRFKSYYTQTEFTAIHAVRSGGEFLDYKIKKEKNSKCPLYLFVSYI